MGESTEWQRRITGIEDITKKLAKKGPWQIICLLRKFLFGAPKSTNENGG